MTFTIKRGDTSPPIKFQLIAPDGAGKDIRGFNDVQFFMREAEDIDVVVSDNVAGEVDVVDAEQGIVQYLWQDGDTDSAGEYEAEWEVEYGDGSLETFPNNDYIDVEIVEDIQ